MPAPLPLRLPTLCAARRRHRWAGAPHAVVHPPAEVLAGPPGSGGEVVEAPEALLAARPPLVQKRMRPPIGLIKRPPRRAQHDGEAIADHLADAFGSL